MATRLAVLGFFRPQLSLQEELDADQPSRLLSSPLALSFRSQCWSCVRPRPDHSRVHNFSSPLSSVAVGAPPAPPACDGSHMQRCHEPLDTLGRHRAACTRSGRVKKRAGPTERVLARVCREAAARVKFNAALRDMNPGAPGGDERRIEVLAQDLPRSGGAQLAVDITLRALCARQVNLNLELLRLMAQSWCEHGATRKTHILSWSLQGVAAWWWWPLRQGAAGVMKERISLTAAHL